MTAASVVFVIPHCIIHFLGFLSSVHQRCLGYPLYSSLGGVFIKHLPAREGGEE